MPFYDNLQLDHKLLLANFSQKCEYPFYLGSKTATSGENEV
jgi:hypothetical protein